MHTLIKISVVVLMAPVFTQAGLAAQVKQKASSARPFAPQTSVLRIAGSFVRKLTGTLTNQSPVQQSILRDASWSKLPPQHQFQGGGIPASGDFDGDGDQDLLMAMPNGGVEVWINNGAGRFVDDTAARIFHPGNRVSALLVGDVDLDGDLDFVTGTADSLGGFGDRIWLNDGTGGFTIFVDIPTGGVNTGGVAMGDYNGDGFVDLVFAVGQGGHGTTGGVDRLYFGDPFGNFTSSAAFAQSAWNETITASTSVSSGDVDGDGDLDLFITKYDGASATGSPGAYNVILLNDGVGHFTDASATRLLPARRKDNSSDATLSDLDGDGDLDMVISNSLLSVSGPLSGDVLWNQGGVQGGQAGYFVDGVGDLQEIPSLAESIRLGQVVADFNADGLKDVLFLVHDLPPGGQQPLFMGQAGGNFVRSPHFRTSTFVGSGVHAFDSDGDGDPDVIMTAAGSAAGGLDSLRTRLFVNRIQ